MVTKQRIAIRLFLREHRDAKRISAPEMARRLGIERESLYRLERNARLTPEKQTRYAAALGLKA